jgi:hypothetical protein
MFVLAGPGVSSTEAASFDPGISQQNVMGDYYNGNCAPFSTVPSYVDAYGNPVYQPLPFYGDPYAMYQQCITQNNFNCNAGYGIGYGYGYNPFNYGACNFSCPGSSTQYVNGVPVCIGPPAQVLFAPSPTSVTCGGASNLELAVLDSNGFRVLNGTDVSFTTTLGYISTSEGTKNGLTTTSLTIPSKTSGQALVTATAGGASAQKLISVSC